MKINKAKTYSVISLFSAIASGYYFLNSKTLYALVFIGTASILDSASLGGNNKKQKNWHPPLKNALDRTADAAIFIGFALSGIVPKDLGAIILVFAIILPYWIKKIWKINIRRFLHAGVVAIVIILA